MCRFIAESLWNGYVLYKLKADIVKLTRWYKNPRTEAGIFDKTTLQNYVHPKPPMFMNRLIFFPDGEPRVLVQRTILFGSREFPVFI